MENEKGGGKHKKPRLDLAAASSDFELSIRPGKRCSATHPVTGDIEQLVVLASGTQYEIGLRNSTSKRANGRVFVDGKEVLHMRLEPNSDYFFERPSDIPKKFTFYPLKFAKVQFPQSHVLFADYHARNAH